MTNPDREELVKLEAERAELIAKNEAATSWGAAVGARSERIKEIDGRIAALMSNNRTSKEFDGGVERRHAVDDGGATRPTGDAKAVTGSRSNARPVRHPPRRCDGV